MISGFTWKSRTQAPQPALRHDRLAAVLAAAVNTRYYQGLFAQMPELAAGVFWSRSHPEEVLSFLPRTELECLRTNPRAFHNRKAQKEKAQTFFHPLPLPQRTAILLSGFRDVPGVKVFSEISRRGLARYKPESLAGPVNALRRLAEGHEDRGAWVPRLTHSVIAFVVPSHGFLSAEARDLLWRVFQVPIFCQFLGLRGELLAWECEAHEGLHVEEEHAVFEIDGSRGQAELLVTSLVNYSYPVLRLATGLTAELEVSRCGCGRHGLRLVNLQRKALRPSTSGFQKAAESSCAAD